MTITAGSLFLRNFLLGFLLIFISLIAFRQFELGGNYSSMIAGLAFFLINCGVLGLYTLAVLKNEQLLAQEDSADYAYYLGFCLTVLTLAVSFGYDAMSVRQGNEGAEVVANQSSALVRNALIQFAAGLFATVLGLCAKIYITSQQSLTTAEPEELYRRFRHEIYGFQTELRSSVTGISASFKQVSDELSLSAQQVSQSVSQLIGAINESSKDLSTTLSKANLEQFASDFVQTINSLKEASGQISASVNLVTTELGQLSAVSSTTNTNISSLGATVSAFDKNSQMTSETLQKYNESLLRSTAELVAQNQSLAQACEQVNKFSGMTESLIRIATPLEKVFITLDNTAKDFGLSMTNTSSTLSSLQKEIIEVNSLFSSLGAAINTSTSASEKLSKSLERNEQLGNANADVTSTLSVAQNSLQEKIKLAALSVDSLSQETKKLSEFLPLVGNAITNVNLQELESSLRGLNEASKALVPKFSSTGPVIDQLTNSISSLTNSSDNHKQKLVEFDTTLNKLSSDSEVIRRNVSALSNELEKLKDFIPLFGQSMSQVSFADLSRSISRLASESDALAGELRSKNTSR